MAKPPAYSPVTFQILLPILVPAVSPQPTRRTEKRMVRIGALAVTLVIAMAGAAAAQTPSGKVAVVTSFSKQVTDPMKKAFEKAHPGVLLDVQNRNTNAGVKFLEETRRTTIPTYSGPPPRTPSRC